MHLRTSGILGDVVISEPDVFDMLTSLDPVELTTSVQNY